MPKQVIISDTTILIAFGNIDRLWILKELYDGITVTPEVMEEFGEPLPDWVKVEAVLDKDKVRLLELELDSGESSAIALALEHPESLLIIDERKGRRVAKLMGIDVTGTLGILIKAKRNGIVKKVEPILQELKNANFRISSSLIVAVLKQTGEAE